MVDQKEKKDLSGQVKMPASLKREIRLEAARLDLYEYQVIEGMWRAYQGAPQLPAPMVESPKSWEHSALVEILESPFASAIRENLKAFRLAAEVMRERAGRDAAPTASDSASGVERAREIEREHRRGKADLDATRSRPRRA